MWGTSSTEVTEYHLTEPGWCFYNNNFLLPPWCEGYLCCWYLLMTFWLGDIDDWASESQAMFKAFDCNISLFYGDSNDVSVVLEQLESNQSSIWMDFVQYFLPENKLSYVKNSRMREKHDALIKFLYLVMKNNLNATPLHVSLVQKMYDLTQSKEIIKISSSLGFCCGYKTTKNLDLFIAKWIILRVCTNGVPVPWVFTTYYLISWAMDNFGKFSIQGCSHDTVLNLFQHVPKNMPL